MKTGIFYGSATGTTAQIAEKIGKLLNVDGVDIHDVANTAPSEVGKYDVLIMGLSTWGDGELEDDWYDFIAGVEALDLKGKKVALFGCGDESMTDTFCNAVGELHDRLEPTGCTFIAPYDTIGYTFEESKAKPGDALEAYGLLLDEVNHPELTAPRLAGWTTIVRESAS